MVLSLILNRTKDKFQSNQNKQSSRSKKEGDKNFVISRYTISVKLISIISGIIVIAMVGMILFASASFAKESRTRIEENNLNLVSFVGEWFNTEIDTIRDRSRSILEDSKQNRTKDSGNFFATNNNVLYLGVADGNLRFSDNLYNRKLMSLEDLKVRDISRLHNLNKKPLRNAFSGQFTIFNASNGSKAYLGLAMRSSGKLLVTYVKPDYLFEVFKAQQFVTIFIVNSNGGVVLHPDVRPMLSRTDFSERPIVKSMWESSPLSGQKSYSDKAEEVDYLAAFKKLPSISLGIIAQTKEDDVFAPVREIQYRNILIMFLFLCIAIVLVYFFAKRMAAPLKTLVEATNKVAEGEYNVLIEPGDKDEVGHLIHSFGGMVKGLGEREKIKDAFGRFVNKELAEQAMTGELKLGGEEKNAAIFFSDLRGFTAMSEKMTPEEVVLLLNEYFTDMVNCILKTNGVVDKYIGDAIMAHWGALKTKGDPTENAINAGLLMRKALIQFNELGKGKRPILKMGSGINTGKVISGQIGSSQRLEFTVIGDSVNLASRIEALNKPFATDLLISEYSYRIVKDIYKFAKMPPIKVKGKTDPLHIFAVLGHKDDPATPNSLVDLRKLVGITPPKEDPANAAAQKEEKFEIIDATSKK